MIKFMKETIYKFLDEYVGDGTRCELAIPSLGRTWTDHWEVFSDNGTMILWFIVKRDMIKVYRSESLCRKIEGYFGVENTESWKYIRDWFGEKHNIKVLSDLLKLTLKEKYGTN